MKRTFTLFATLSLVVFLSAASLYGTVWEVTPRIKVTGLWQSGDIALHLFDDGHYEVDLNGTLTRTPRSVNRIRWEGDLKPLVVEIGRLPADFASIGLLR